jgi:hypothetical protein
MMLRRSFASLYASPLAGLRRLACAVLLAVSAAPALADWGTDFESADPFSFVKVGKAGTGALTTNFNATLETDAGDQFIRISTTGSTNAVNLATYAVTGHALRDVRVRANIARNNGANINGMPGVVARLDPATGACYAFVVDFTNRQVQLQRWTAGSGVPTVLRTSNVNNLITTNAQLNVELICVGSTIVGNLWDNANNQVIQSEGVQDSNITTGIAGIAVASRISGGVGINLPGGEFSNASAISAIKDADLNKDGFDDIYWRNQNVGNQGVWLLNSAGLIGGWSGLPFVGDLNWRQITTGDFDQDNQIDVLWHNAVTNEVAVWALNANGTLKSFQVVGLTPAGWRPQAAADFNRDGNVDIFLRNTSTGENGIWFMQRQTLTGFTGVSFVGNLAWNVEATGDFNRDGSPDLLWRNNVNGEVAFWLMNGPRLAEFQLFTQIDPNWQIIGSGDFNNDSLVDILWRNNSTNLVVQWFMVGTIYSSWQPVEFIPAVEWRGIN